MRIEVVVADITTLSVDAIVNAANERLLGGGGVDGAIHRAAGPELLEACRALPIVRPGVRCPTGQARLTTAGLLPAAHVIHTVGPVWLGGDNDEAELLVACYQASLELARTHVLRTIAFPAISCGIFGFPPGYAVPLAVDTVRAWEDAHPETVVFCCHDEAMADRYRDALAMPWSGSGNENENAGNDAGVGA
jgi:O-acetyl-ADP-ribose deacetylase (regulator of RNase III)